MDTNSFLGEDPMRRELRLLHSSIGGLMSVCEAERDERGRFKRRSESTARERQPSIPFLAEWWMAI